MQKDIKRVEKIISGFLSQQHVHSGHKILEIKNETISTYDGTYPAFEIIYEGKKSNKDRTPYLLSLEIEKYTGLKRNTDFWIGVSWE